MLRTKESVGKASHIGKLRLRLPLGPGYTVACAMEEVGARPSEFVAETSTMIIIGLILGAFGIGFLCWALFTLAVYPLPFFAGVTAGLAGSTAARA